MNTTTVTFQGQTFNVTTNKVSETRVHVTMTHADGRPVRSYNTPDTLSFETDAAAPVESYFNNARI